MCKIIGISICAVCAILAAIAIAVESVQFVRERGWDWEDLPAYIMGIIGFLGTGVPGVGFILCLFGVIPM